MVFMQEQEQSDKISTGSAPRKYNDVGLASNPAIYTLAGTKKWSVKAKMLLSTALRHFFLNVEF